MHVDKASAEAKHERPCHECGKTIRLRVGRHSGKYFYQHINSSNCLFDQFSFAIKFDSADAAEKAETVLIDPDAKSLDRKPEC